MQRFIQIISESTESHIENFNKIEELIYTELENSGSTRLVLTLQKMQWERAVFAIGMFSLFEAEIQNELKVEQGSAFKELKKRLKEKGKNEIILRFEEFYYAINALKHGRGQSYNKLLENKNLPFKISSINGVFTNEGDVSEIETLILVDNGFLEDCLAVIRICYNEILRMSS
ncbi:hypothetical protein FQ084_01730 [Psychrobacter sp. ANT_WB68]|nr:hypothetical protein FQ084_01730 [Psychrobacter sp. ANT_WB68]